MNDTLVDQAKYLARLKGLDPALVCAVVEQESGWNTWAMRYEPAFFQKYVAHQVNLSDTERQARATSWGLMQVMGEVARERGFKPQFLSSLCDPDLGLNVGCDHLKHMLDLANGDQAQALLKWNGGGNAEYPLQVIARIDRYK